MRDLSSISPAQRGLLSRRHADLRGSTRLDPLVFPAMLQPPDERPSNVMNKKFIGATIAVLLAAASVVLILSNRTTLVQAKPRILAIVALTGSAADWGQTAANSIKLAFQDRPFELVIENAPAEEIDRSVTALKRALATQRPYAIIGPTWDDVAAAFAPIIDQGKIVTLAPDASSGVERDRDFPYWFSLFAPEDIEMQVLTSSLRDKGIRTAVAIYNQDPFSQQMRDAFVGAAGKVGLNLLADLPVADAESRDFRAQLIRAKALQPDVLFVEFADQNAKGPLMRQVKELAIGSLVVSSATTDTQSTLDQFGSTLDGLTFASPKVTSEFQKFADRYQALFGSTPTAPSAGPAYDAAMMLISAWDAGKRTSDELRDYLLSLKSYQGVSAQDMRFSPKGRVIWPITAYQMRTIRDGKVINFK